MEIIYLLLHCHHQNDSCIKVGRNVSLIVRDNVSRQCPQTVTFEEKEQPKQIRTEIPLLTSLNALPLGQTGSHLRQHRPHINLRTARDGKSKTATSTFTQVI